MRQGRGHAHTHEGEHVHVPGETEGFRLTPWILFTPFLLGPCEPMIPLVMYPAARGSWGDVGIVVVGFTLPTLGSMLLVVLLALKGISLLRVAPLERYSHAVAGGTILAVGCAIQFVGL